MGVGEDRDAEARRAELERRLAAVRERIAAACAAAGRDPDQVELMAVTKTVPAADVAVLLDLGLTLFGENRAQEAGAKVAEVAALRPDARPRWHFIGGLQRNKARAVVAWADRVESVDSVRLADALDRAAAHALRRGPTHRPAARAAAVQRRRRPERVAACPRTACSPWPTTSPAAGRCASRDSWPSHRWRGCRGRPRDGLRRHRDAAADRLRSAHPAASVLSAGMSGDLEVAIRHASGVVRVGTALVGYRPLASL